MADQTTGDLANATLRQLRVIMPGETANADDVAEVKARYSAKYLELQDEGLAYWPETVIPELVVLPLAKIMAGELATDFWAGTPLVPEMRSLAQLGMDRLYKITEKPTTGEPVRADYF